MPPCLHRKYLQEYIEPTLHILYTLCVEHKIFTCNVVRCGCLRLQDEFIHLDVLRLSYSLEATLSRDTSGNTGCKVIDQLAILSASVDFYYLILKCVCGHIARDVCRVGDYGRLNMDEVFASRAEQQIFVSSEAFDLKLYEYASRNFVHNFMLTTCPAARQTMTTREASGGS